MGYYGIAAFAITISNRQGTQKKQLKSERCLTSTDFIFEAFIFSPTLLFYTVFRIM